MARSLVASSQPYEASILTMLSPNKNHQDIRDANVFYTGEKITNILLTHNLMITEVLTTLKRLTKVHLGDRVK